MKKKIITGLLLLTTLVGAFGCQGNGGGVDKNDIKTDVLQLAIVNKGYGTEFLSKLAESFETKTGKEVSIVSNSSMTAVTRESLTAYKTNGIDLYFAIEDQVDDLIYQGKSVVPGQDCVFADLSTLYDEPLEGWGENVTLKDVIDPFYYKASTHQANGKQYTTNWAMGVEGLIYNNDLFTRYDLDLPRTTDEMFELMDKIKGLNVKDAYGNPVYPFTYPGLNDYLYYLTYTWFAQYSGAETFYNFLAGRNNEGKYTPDIFLNKGLYEAYLCIEKLIFIGGKSQESNGYVSNNDTTSNFTQAQVLFLDGSAFMMPNGDWLDREANSNVDAGKVDVRFMKTPIISTIKNTLPRKSITSDAVLRAVVDYVDGTTTEKPAGVADEDIEYVRKARNVVCSEVGHMCFIPSYSNNIEAAKEFLLYMYSKEGQEIVSRYAYGNVAPLKVDFTSLSNYEAFTNLQKSKFVNMQNATYISRTANEPMNYRGALRPAIKHPEQTMGVSVDSNSYMNAQQLVTDTYNTVKSYWSLWMDNAGLQ